MKILDWLFGRKDTPGKTGFDSNIYRNPIKAPKVQISSSTPSLSGTWDSSPKGLVTLDLDGVFETMRQVEKIKRDIDNLASKQMMDNIGKGELSKVSDRPIKFQDAYIKILNNSKNTR